MGASLHSTNFRAMDTEIDVLIEVEIEAEIEAEAPPMPAFMSARVLFASYERIFSRFLPDSLLSQLNRGETVTDATFAAACRIALHAWEFTGGLFNPMVLESLERAGYAKTFASTAGGELAGRVVPNPALSLKFEGEAVRLLGGRLDLGGIVKGWTVDAAVGQLVRDHPNVLVNAGGDVHCAGAEAGLPGWEMAVDDGGGKACWEGRLKAAMATSSSRKRSWRTDAGARAHHLIDPRTGLPSTSPYTQATVWAEQTWIAECWAKAVVIGGEAAAAAVRAAGFEVLAIEG